MLLVGKLVVLCEFRKSFKGRGTSPQQVLSQPAKFSRHLHERILFGLAAIPGKQFKFGATEITGS
jgi:hypothetical protein